MSKVKKKEKLENFLFKWLLIVSIPFWLHRIIRDFALDSSSYNLTVDLSLLLGTLLILFLLRYESLIDRLKRRVVGEVALSQRQPPGIGNATSDFLRIDDLRRDERAMTVWLDDGRPVADAFRKETPCS